MKTTITLHSSSSDKIQLLLRIAQEMGVTTSVTENISSEDNDWQLASEKTLAKDWLNAEDDKWDDFLKSKLK